MIQRLGCSSISFQKNDISPREAYDSKIAQNVQMTQTQNNNADAMIQASNQNPVQNAGQKLDVVA